ncbi:MAG: hypothetical protein HC811_14600, partial [Flammeovirgaceae bacterium]|nr:hypothetical protein [Flammeovirgaceae bacterium]
MRYFVIIVLVIGLASCGTNEKSAGWEITLSGKVGFPQTNGFIVLEEVTQDETPN